MPRLDKQHMLVFDRPYAPSYEKPEFDVICIEQDNITRTFKITDTRNKNWVIVKHRKFDDREIEKHVASVTIENGIKFLRNRRN